jgi:hypothetical protein
MNIVIERIRHLAEDAGLYCTDLRSGKNLSAQGMQIHPSPYRDKHVTLMPEAGTIVAVFVETKCGTYTYLIDTMVFVLADPDLFRKISTTIGYWLYLASKKGD